MIKTFESIVPWEDVLKDLNGEEIVEIHYEKKIARDK